MNPTLAHLQHADQPLFFIRDGKLDWRPVIRGTLFDADWDGASTTLGVASASDDTWTWGRIQVTGRAIREQSKGVWGIRAIFHAENNGHFENVPGFIAVKGGGWFDVAGLATSLA